MCGDVCVFVALHMSLKAYGRALSPTGSFRRNVHAPWCARTAPRAVQRWPGGSAHRWHPVPCRAVAGCTPIGALLRCRASSGGGGAGAMRLPRMRRAWARPRRPRGHPALLMVAHQGPSPCTRRTPAPPLARLRIPALARLRASAASCFCSAASDCCCRRSRQPLLRLRLLWRLLTAPPARAGVPPVPDLRRQGHEVQPKRADARRDRLQEAPQPVRERARALRPGDTGGRLDHALSSRRTQRSHLRTGRSAALGGSGRLWAALGGSALAGPAPVRVKPARASRLQDRRSHPPPLSLLLRPTQEPGGRILRRRHRPLRRRARPVLHGAPLWRPCGPGAHAWRRPCPPCAAACVTRAPW